jgi:hypothetical protein
MTPRRPVLFEEQYALAVVTGIVLVAGIAAVVLVLANS